MKILFNRLSISLRVAISLIFVLVLFFGILFLTQNIKVTRLILDETGSILELKSAQWVDSGEINAPINFEINGIKSSVFFNDIKEITLNEDGYRLVKSKNDVLKVYQMTLILKDDSKIIIERDIEELGEIRILGIDKNRIKKEVPFINIKRTIIN